MHGAKTNATKKVKEEMGLHFTTKAMYLVLKIFASDLRLPQDVIILVLVTKIGLCKDKDRPASRV